jgi:hypothetical protein
MKMQMQMQMQRKSSGGDPVRVASFFCDPSTSSSPRKSPQCNNAYVPVLSFSKLKHPISQLDLGKHIYCKHHLCCW